MIHNSKNVIKEISSLTLFSGIASAISYFITLALANTLGAYDFGIYSYCMVWGNLLSAIIIFSTDFTAPAFYSKTKDKQKIFNAVISTRLFLFLFFMLIIPLFFLKDPEIALGVFAIMFSTFNLSFFYEISQKNISYSKVYLLERLIYILIILFLLFRNLIDIKLIFTTFLLSTLISIVLQFNSFKKYLRNFQPLNIIIEPKSFLKDNFFILMITLSTFIYGGFSRILIESKFGLEELGVYSAGWQIILIVTIFQAQVTKVWRTKISFTLVSKNLALLKKNVLEYAIFSTLPIIIFSLFIFIFSEKIVDILFPEGFRQLNSILPIFSFYFVFINLEALAGIFWISIGSKKIYLIINLIFSVSLLFSLILIPQSFGLVFFALSITIIFAVYNIILLSIFYFRYINKLTPNCQMNN